MGFGISLGGTKTTSGFSETSTQDITKVTDTTKLGTTTQTQQQLQEQQQTGTQKTDKTGLSEQLTTLSQLDEETQATLRTLISDISGGQAGVTELTQFLTQRATGADEFGQAQTGAIVAQARQRGEEQVGQAVQAAAGQAGSSKNTIVQQLALREQINLETELAGLAATLGLQARGAATEEITGAIGTGAGQTGVIAQLAEVLKGAEQTGTAQVQTQEQQTAIQELLSLITGTTTGVTKVDEQVSETGATTVATTATGTGKATEKGVGIGISI